jgi:hypothetical protein
LPQQETINIRPESGILAILSYLNYKPWFALAEFVDNALQSHLSERNRLKATDGAKPLIVRIKFDQGANRISISDNAAGIAWKDFPRAFKAAQLPPDRTGLSEFGLGMKTAACWFARRWSVRTSALGESTERNVCIDLDEIRRTDAETLTVFSASAPSNAHYTEIDLDGLYQGLPRHKTLWKVRDHLRDIYRCYTRDGLLELWLNEELLTFEEKLVLVAPKYGRNNQAVDDNDLVWRKDVEFQFGDGCRAHGFAGILDKASTTKAGFALFRRRRLIVGSDDETYRPHTVSGGPNDYQFQRLFGELHIEGVQVSHTKDGFRWGGYEEEFLQKLREQIDAEPLALIKQSNNFRKLAKKGTDDAAQLKKATENAGKKVEDAVEGASEELTSQAESTETSVDEPDSLEPAAVLISERYFDVEVSGKKWSIGLQFDNDPANGNLVEVADDAASPGSRSLSYRVGLAHPFVQAFVGANLENLELIAFVAAAVALAEKTTQLGGVDEQAARMRVNISNTLRAMAQARQ